jgi:shikimate dehydrogenase
VAASDFEPCVLHLADSGYRGASVTIPHKYSAAKIAASDDDVVAATRAANALKFGDTISCRNTDAKGFFEPIRDLPTGSALVLGAGAAAETAVYVLKGQGWSVRVWNRSPQRLLEMAKRHAIVATEHPDATGCSLIVNATPVGLKEEGLPPLDWQSVEEYVTVFDLAYSDGPTGFLQKARAMNFQIIDGREMLVEQGALAFEWWLGRAAPRDVMRTAVGL